MLKKVSGAYISRVEVDLKMSVKLNSQLVNSIRYADDTVLLIEIVQDFEQFSLEYSKISVEMVNLNEYTENYIHGFSLDKNKKYLIQ